MLPALIVALGASNTEGYGVGREHAYPAVVARLLAARGIAVQLVNAGISGNTTGAMLARLERDVPSGAAIVLFQPGSNDARLGIPDAVRQRNIEAITERLTRRGTVVLRVARAFELTRPGNLQPDGIHFTAAGHARIAALLVDEVAAAVGH